MSWDDEFETDPTERVEREQRKAPQGPSLKARAIDLLSRREHSRLELQRKLSRYSQDEDEITALLDLLEREKWLSNTRFAQSLVNRRASKHGTLRIVQELKQSGVAQEDISLLTEELRETEFERAVEVWFRKFGCLPEDQKAYTKQARFLVSRGFALSTLHRILDTVKAGDIDLEDY
ncbi:recombination regulator RecX [Paenalcaligenes sp. Me131]|uniref:recombination regulator RecX n=1 Tax=Paenalcaligenes sp. Me131 TaxID=3392636 RepID=UPI003D2E8C85